MIYINTNVILRYLLDDDPLLSPKAKSRIEVVAELVYVLTGIYKVPRKEIAEILTSLFYVDSWQLHQKEAVLGAIKLFGIHR